jgi:nicotinamidase-related amidase
MRALIVIDMLKDFIYEEGALYCGKKVKKIIPIVKKKINEAHKEGSVVIFLTDAHNKDDLEFKRFPPHCIKQSWGAEIIDELDVRKEDYIVPKTRYSGFYNTNLDAILKKHNITKADVVGVCTSICVMDTVGELKNRDIEVRIFKEGVADFDEEFHEFALKRMKRIYKAEIE